MNNSLKWFRQVVWVGILANVAFCVCALFGDPRGMLGALSLGESHSTVWLFNYSVLLLILSCFYVPAARDPIRYRANAWLLVFGRLVPATTFFVGVGFGFMPHGFLLLGAGDATIGVLELWLLLMLEARQRELEEAEPMRLRASGPIEGLDLDAATFSAASSLNGR